MSGWLPTAFFVSSFAVTTITLLIVASKRWRHKRLTSEVSKLTTLVANLKAERQDAWDKAKEAVKLAEERRKEALFESTQKDGLYTTLQDRERQLADLASLRVIRTEQAKNIKDHVIITIKNLRPYKLATIYLEQPLIDFEVELIDKSLNTANARISLANLVVPISVGDGSQVETKNLRMPEDDATFEDCRKTNNE